jgi:tripeptidyl-peptidase I
LKLHSFVSPSQKTKEVFTKWLSSHNISATPITPAGDWVQIRSLPVSKANALFNASYSTFVHLASGSKALRTLSYSIPEELKGYVDAIHPGSSFDFGTKAGPIVSSIQPSKTYEDRINSNGVISSISKASKTTPLVNASCATLVTPTCLRELYGIPISAPRNKNNRLTVTGYTNQFAQKADLEVRC